MLHSDNMTNRTTYQSPMFPVKNAGEGPATRDTDANYPVIPLPNPGEGPVIPDNIGGDVNYPVIPLPNPGEGPVIPDNIGGSRPNQGGSGNNIPWRRYARVRFLNASRNYRPFRIFVNNTRLVRSLSSMAISSFAWVPSGYQTIAVTGQDGYAYIRKSLPFQAGNLYTVVIMNTASGLDLLQVQDTCCTPTNSFSNFRVCNVAFNSNPIDVLLADGRVVYDDVRFKQVTAFKRIRPGGYQFYFAETDLKAPVYQDIETTPDIEAGNFPEPEAALAGLYLNVQRRATYTVYIVSQGTAPEAIQTLVIADR